MDLSGLPDEQTPVFTAFVKINSILENAASEDLLMAAVSVLKDYSSVGRTLAAEVLVHQVLTTYCGFDSDCYKVLRARETEYTSSKMVASFERQLVASNQWHEELVGYQNLVDTAAESQDVAALRAGLEIAARGVNDSLLLKALAESHTYSVLSCFCTQLSRALSSDLEKNAKKHNLLVAELNAAKYELELAQSFLKTINYLKDFESRFDKWRRDFRAAFNREGLFAIPDLWR